MSAQAPERVLVRLPNWIGDVVMATPFLRALRRHWPEARVTVAGPASASSVLGGLSSWDELVPLSRRSQGGVAGLLGGARALAAGRHDLAFVLTHSFSSALVVALARVPRRVGWSDGGRGWLLTESLRSSRERPFHRRPQPMVELYAQLLDRVGVPRAGSRTELATTEEDEARAEAWLERQVPDRAAGLVGIHPGASFGPSKLWDPSRFAAVADTLHRRHGVRPVVFCGPGEAGLARSIAMAARTPVATAADDPLDLGALKAVVRRLRLLVTTDTGPRHFAAPFDVPAVVLMGPTDPRFTNTNLQRSLIVRTGVACSPCQRKVCPIDHRCMTRMHPPQVLAAAERLLAR